MTIEAIDESAAVSLIEDLLTDDLDMVGEDVVEPVEEERSEEVTNESDEDAGEESDEESDEDSPEADDEDDSEESEETEASVVDDETLVDIQIGDDTYEVNFAELKAGYLRNEEFVNRAAALEAEHQEKVTALELKEAELAKELLAASVMINGDLSKFENINWDALKEKDPELYKNAKIEAMEAKEKAALLNQRRTAIEKMHNEAQRLRHQAYLQSQAKLAEKMIPEFNDEGFFDKVVAYAATVGYTADDVASIADARQLVLLNNARLYAESVVRKKETVEKKLPKDLPPVVKPGQTKANDSGKRKATNQAANRMKSEKSVEAAAAYLMTLDI